jgi:hypothetical protein
LPSVNTTINGLNPFLDPVSREESSRAGGPARSAYDCFQALTWVATRSGGTRSAMTVPLNR